MDLKDAAGNFSQLCGVLAGFCIAFVILLLTPAVFSSSGGITQDWAVSLVILSAALYMLSAAIFANVARFKSVEMRWPYNLGITIFHLSNVLTLGALVIIIRAFGLPLASQVVTGVLILSGVIFVVNITVSILPHIRRWLVFLFLPPAKRQRYKSIIKSIREGNSNDMAANSKLEPTRLAVNRVAGYLSKMIRAILYIALFLVFVPILVLIFLLLIVWTGINYLVVGLNRIARRIFPQIPKLVIRPLTSYAPGYEWQSDLVETVMEIEDTLSIELPSAEFEKIRGAFVERDKPRIMDLLRKNTKGEIGVTQWSKAEERVERMLKELDRHTVEH